MLWNENTNYQVVVVDGENPSIIRQKFRPRHTVEEAKLDIACYNHRCRCHLDLPRNDGVCLRYSRVEPKDKQTIEYIENDRGFRALPHWV